MGFKRFIARWKMRWGFCPECDSDAPAIDTCPVCRGLKEWPPSLITHVIRWDNWWTIHEKGAPKKPAPKLWPWLKHSPYLPARDDGDWRAR